MKIMIEVSGGCLVGITTTEDCEIYLVDHDNLREGCEETILSTEDATHPDVVTNEGGHVAFPGASNTPMFDAALDEALAPYRVELEPCDK